MGRSETAGGGSFFTGHDLLEAPLVPISGVEVRAAALTVAERVLLGVPRESLGAPDGARVGESAAASLRVAQISEVFAMLGITEETLREGMFNAGQAVA